MQSSDQYLRRGRRSWGKLIDGRALKLRQLTTHRSSRDLRWTQDGTRSLRAYAVAADDEPCPCVSTRSGELNLVLDGELVLEIGPKKQIVRIGRGDACLVPRRLAHAVRVARGGRVLLIDVHGEAADNGPRIVPAHVLPARLLGAVDRAWGKSAREVFHATWEVAEDVTRRLSSREPIRIETTAGTQRMLRVKQILEARFTQPPSLDELAQTLKMNPFYLLREFKRHFAFSPLAYAQFLRTEHFVWELLGVSSRATLLERSADAGFGDYSTFQRRIREQFGRSPSLLVDDDAGGSLGPG
jgi:AraC-like DNA-binding protein/mannose-6-phosphate isomerase-like protein (cupin superfamily)